MELPSILMRKPDATQSAFALRFNQLSNDRQNFGQGRSSKNQLQNVKYRLAGKEGRLVLRLFNYR